MSPSQSDLGKALIGRIDRYRRGKTDLPSLIMELHLFVETYDTGELNWMQSFQQAWSDLVQCAEPIQKDPANAPPPDPKIVDRHLREIERLLREL